MRDRERPGLGEKKGCLRLGVADAVDLYAIAPAAEADAAARCAPGVVGLGPEMKAEQAAEVAHDPGLVRAMRPEPLQGVRQLRIGRFSSEFGIVIRHWQLSSPRTRCRAYLLRHHRGMEGSRKRLERCGDPTLG